MTPNGEHAPAVAERFGANLRRARRRKGLSQERIAVRASLHRTEISMLERGERVPRIDTLIRLAGAMVVRPEELLDGIVWLPAPETEGTFTHESTPLRHRFRKEAS
jgi:transcriptional regulator with XRE-family HTH domain